MKHLFNWVEILVTDMKRAIGFYSGILDVKFNEMELGPVKYALFRLMTGSIAGHSHRVNITNHRQREC